MQSPRRSPAWARLAGLAVVILTLLSACSQAATPTPLPSPTASPTPTPSPTGSPTPTPTPSPTPNPFEGRRVTLLVLGNDSTPSRVAQGLGKLTDAMIVVSVSADRSQVSMISFPRDFVDFPMGDGTLWRSKINAIAYYKGEAALKKTLATTMGQPIDYYVELNMGDFAKLVDAIGGVDVVAPITIVDPSIHFSITAGKHHLTGAQALGFARSRHTTSDWDRDARQQILVEAILRKIIDPGTNVDLRALVDALQSFQTDLPLDRMGALLQLVRDAMDSRVTKQVLTPPRFTLFAGIEQGTGRGYIEEPNIPAIRAYAKSVLGD